MVDQRKNPRLGWHGWLAVLAVLALIPALVENGDNLPLDAHEALVARTAEEMAQQGDWLVPQFNGEPRLQKPPLAYWAVMATDMLMGDRGNISDWEARVPSIIGGVVLVMATALLGAQMVGRRTGWLAGLLVASSSGYLSYTHSARPEMLYAALCTTGLLLFATAWRTMTIDEANVRRARWLAWSGWLMMGLAILAKGPQLPVLIMAGWMIGLWATGQRGLIGRAVRPGSGALLAVAVSSWWYVAVAFTVPRAINLWQFETIDRSLIAESLLDWLEPYYFYRTAALIVPWVLAFPFVLAFPWLTCPRASATGRLLWWTMVACLVGLSLPAGRRWYYMLPAIAPLAILTAEVMNRFSFMLLITGRGRLWRGLLSVHCLGCGAAGVVLAVSSVGNRETQVLMAGIGAAMGLATAFYIWRRTSDQRQAAAQAAVVCAIASLTLFTTMAEAELLWRRKRFDEAEFAMKVRKQVKDEDSLVVWGSVWEAGTYYVERVIPVVSTTSRLNAVLHRNPGERLWVLTHDDEQLPPKFDSAIRLEFKDDNRVCLRLWSVETVAMASSDPQ